MNFEGKNIIVTGGAGIGVGGGVCQAIDKFGGRIIMVDIESDKIEKALKRYQRAKGYAADISKQKDVDHLFEQIRNDYDAVHGLVNNAGVGLSKEAHEASENEFDHLMAINFKAMWMCSKQFVRMLLERNQTGNIVNISSVHAYATTCRYALYCSSKNAIEGLTKGTAVEWGRHGIRVNAIGPGYVHAEQNYDLMRTWTDDPEGWVESFRLNHQVNEKSIDPIEVGYAAAFLLSDYASTITGQTIYTDRGTTRLLFGRDFVD
jgi:NAD(P)-dependent dehydrogenase (short-subunit alcohol dehydrogenase family)